MNIQKCQNYQQKSFTGWSNLNVTFAEKAKAIAKLAQEEGKDAVKMCVKNFNELNDTSPYHLLYIDTEKYGAIGRSIYAPSFAKSRNKKSFQEILKEFADFINKENPQLDRAANFKKKISPILLLHENNGMKYGWYGAIETLKDRLVLDMQLSKLTSKAQRKIQVSLNRINRVLNHKKLFLDVSEHNGNLAFEIRNYKADKLFDASTRCANIPIISKMPLISKNTLSCISDIERFLARI